MKNSRGSILIMMIAAALALSVGFGIIVRAFLMQKNETTQTEQVAARRYLRQWVKTGMDCAKTMVLNPGACGTSAIAIARKGASATPLIATAAAGTAVGDYLVRAYCTGSATKTLRFEVTPSSTTSWTPLFIKETVTCGP